MRISTKSQYGLRAMVYLARIFKEKKISPLRKIAKKENIPLDYLEKIISKLEKEGLVNSKKGVKGGYFLAKSPKKIKIGRIIKVLEGEMVLVKCLKYFCPKEKKCLTKNFWQKLNRAINKTLNSMTLVDLIEK